MKIFEFDQVDLICFSIVSDNIHSGKRQYFDHKRILNEAFFGGVLLISSRTEQLLSKTSRCMHGLMEIDLFLQSTQIENVSQ